jgi:hypothetical protein
MMDKVQKPSNSSETFIADSNLKTNQEEDLLGCSYASAALEVLKLMERKIHIMCI